MARDVAQLTEHLLISCLSHTTQTLSSALGTAENQMCPCVSVSQHSGEEGAGHGKIGSSYDTISQRAARLHERPCLRQTNKLKYKELKKKQVSKDAPPLARSLPSSTQALPGQPWLWQEMQALWIQETPLLGQAGTQGRSVSLS